MRLGDSDWRGKLVCVYDTRSERIWHGVCGGTGFWFRFRFHTAFEGDGGLQTASRSGMHIGLRIHGMARASKRYQNGETRLSFGCSMAWHGMDGRVPLSQALGTGKYQMNF